MERAEIESGPEPGMDLAGARPPDWVSDAVFYQIFPDRFARSDRLPAPGPFEPWDSPPTVHGFKGGDLYGVAEHLGYLSDLGVSAIYLNPIFSSASNHRYHTFDYFHVDPLLGGDEAFDELIAAAHARGMRVILDGVFNHSGRGFWPFHHVLEAGASSPYRDWFYLDEQAIASRRGLRAYPSFRDLRALGVAREAAERPGEASRHVLGYEAWWDLPALPKLNVGHPPMREHLLEAAEHWIGRGADGWRLDVPEEIDDVEFWREFRRRVRAANPEAYIVAEIWHLAPDRVAGDQFDATMDYPLAEAILGFTAGVHLDPAVIATHGTYREAVRPLDGPAFAQRLAEVLTAWGRAVAAAELNLVGSHDLPRFVTMCGGDRASLRLATLIQMTLPGAPCIYYGDEIGLEGDMDPGSRGAFPWDPERWDTALRDWVRSSIALRRAHPVLRHGDLRLLGAAGGSVAYASVADDEWLITAINAGEDAERLTIAAPELAGARLETVPLAAGDGVRPVVVADDGTLDLDVAARSGAVFQGQTSARMETR